MLTIACWKTFKTRDRLGVICWKRPSRRLLRMLCGGIISKSLLIPSLGYYHGKNGGLGFLRKYFFDATWHEVYDFIEFVYTILSSRKLQKNLDHCAINALSEKIQLIDSLMGELPKSPRPTRLRKSRTQCLIQFPMRVLRSIFTMLFRC